MFFVPLKKIVEKNLDFVVVRGPAIFCLNIMIIFLVAIF